MIERVRSGFRATSRRVRPLAAVATLTLAAAAVAPTSANASPSFVFYVFYGSPCVNGTGPANDTLTITLRNGAGTLVGTRSATTNGSGAISMSSCFNRGITGLDHIKATDKSVSRGIAVPKLTINVNRVTDVVSGHAPAGKSVTFSGCHYAQWLDCMSITGGVTATGSGTYSKDFTPTVDLRGTDFVYADYFGPAGDRFEVERYVQTMQVDVGTKYLLGYTNPGTHVTVQLKTASGTLKGTASDVADAASGYWSANLRNSGGTAVMARAGQTVRGTWAGDGALTIPTTSVTGNAATDHISGRCLVGSPVKVRAYHPDFSDTAFAAGTANGTGNFNVDMSSVAFPIDLRHGDLIEAWCLTPHGDAVEFTGSVP